MPKNKKLIATSHIKKITAMTLIMMATLIIILFWLLALPRISGSVISYNIKTTQHNVQKEIDAFTLPGTATYKQVKDVGCTSDSSVGVSIRINCSINGFILITSDNDASKNLQIIEEQLLSAGFKRFILDGQSDREFSAAITRGDTSYNYNYTKESLHPIISLDVLYDQNEYTDELHTLAAPPPVKQGEYLYGLKLSSTYYQCQTSPFDPPCFAPHPY